MTDVGPQPGTGNDLADMIDASVGAAPELRSNPAVAVSVAQQPGDPVQNAQAAAHASNTASRAAAAQQQAPKVGGHKSMFDRIVNDFQNVQMINPLNITGVLAEKAFGIGEGPSGSVHLHAPTVSSTISAGESVGDWTMAQANKPLQQVQREYRYLKDVGERHGIAAVLPSAFAMLGAGVVGGLLGGSEGATLGTEAAGFAAAHIFFPDSWDRAGQPGYVDPHTGLPVSPGRDIAQALGHTPAKGSKDWLSGVVDGMFDVLADPLGQIGKFHADTLSANGAGGLIGRQIGGIGIANVDQAMGRAPVATAFKQIAEMSPGEVAVTWPKLAPISDELGEARSVDEVADVFRSKIGAAGLLTNELPTTTISQGISRAVKQAVTDQFGNNPLTRKLGLLPVSFDPETGEWSAREFNHADNSGATGIYRMLRVGVDRKTAMDTLNAYLAVPASDLGQRKLVFRNAVEQMLLGAGVPQDHPFLSQIRNEIDRLEGGADPGHVGSYGYDTEGNNLSSVWHTDLGRSTSAALWEGQTSTKDAFPNFGAIQRAIHSTTAAGRLYGGLDDWLYHHWTSTVFKPLALLSGGFGLRVAASELIPNTFRLGLGDIVRARLASTLASYADTVGEEDVSHISAVVDRLVRGIGSDRLIDDAIDQTVANGGHMVAPGVSAGNHISAEFNPAEAASDDLYRGLGSNPKVVETGKYAAFGPAEGNGARSHADIWQGGLAHVASDPAGPVIASSYLGALRNGATVSEATARAEQDVLDWWHNEASPEYRAKFIRDSAPAVEGEDPAQSLARQRVRAFKGLTHTPGRTLVGPDGPLAVGSEPHLDLIRPLANGDVPEIGTLKAVPENEQPIFVPGRETRPVNSPAISRVANWGFRRVVDPIINWLSREPIYLTEYSNQMDTLRPFIIGAESDIPAEERLFTHTEAMQIAQNRAVVKMTPFIHNTLERSQFSEMARNLMPFYFAQEQSYKRFGRLLADDPGAFRRYQMMLTGFAHIGTPTTDASGTNFVTIPGTGWLDAGVVGTLARLGVNTTFGAPVSMNGNLTSLASVFPFTEDINPIHKLGPVATIPIKMLASLFPSTEPALTAIAGGQTIQSSMWDEVFPNSTITRTLQAIPPFDTGHSFQSAALQTMQAFQLEQDQQMTKWVTEGHAPTDPGAPHLVPGPDASPQEVQTYLDRINSQTRINFLLRALVGSVSPVTPNLQIGDVKLKGELNNLTNKLGLAAGYQQFLSEHPDATALTVGLTNNATGAPVDPTVTFQQWMDAHPGVASDYGGAGLWFAPQDPGKYDPSIYSQQLRAGLRTEKTPQQMVDALAIAEGDRIYYDVALPRYESQRAALLGMSQQYQEAVAAQNSGDSGPMAAYSAQASLTARGHGGVLSNLSRAFQQSLQQFGLTHPVWYANYQATQGNKAAVANETIQRFRQMFADGAVPDGGQADGIKTLMDSYDNYYLPLIDPSRFPNGTVPTLVRDEANISWQGYLNAMAKAQPGLAGVIATVFRKANA